MNLGRISKSRGATKVACALPAMAIATCLLHLVPVEVRTSEVLVVFPTTAQSHYRVVRPLVHGLLNRGHRVLAITNFPDAGPPRANLTHIDIAGIKPHSKIGTGWGSWKALSRLVGSTNAYAAVLKHPPVAALLRSGRKFDVVIAEYFTTTPMFAPIAAAVDAPIVGFCPMIAFPTVHDVMGMPTAASYMPSIMGQHSDRMPSFVQRLRNLVNNTALDLLLRWIFITRVRKVNRDHYGARTDSLIESLANVSAVFVNNYPGAFMALPTVPGIIEVGGIHVEVEKPLSQDLNDFVNNAEHGVILFSLGSVVSESSMGADKLNNIIKTFSRLKQRVIMKFDDKSHTILPTNVKVIKWLPQRDLLGHPKVLLFISHAGIMSVIETIHCGKPMVAIPIFGDQQFNANFLVEKQLAVAMEYKHLNSDQLFDAVNEALTEKYKNNAIKLQQLYSDRPQSPLDTAIFWTEYIIRHKNESRELLKSPQIHLSLHQTYLIDVLAAFMLPVVTVVYIIYQTTAYIKSI